MTSEGEKYKQCRGRAVCVLSASSVFIVCRRHLLHFSHNATDDEGSFRRKGTRK
jgi:hypothetical protein